MTRVSIGGSVVLQASKTGLLGQITIEMDPNINKIANTNS